MSERFWVHSDPHPPQADEPEKPPPCLCAACRADCARACRERVCTPCRRRLRSWLGWLPAAYDRLTDALEPVVGSPDGRGGPGGGRLPVNLAALDLVAPGGVVAHLHSWERDWRELRGFTAGPAFRGTQRQALDTVTGFLAAHLDWACEHHPAVAEFAVELAELRGRILAVVPERPRQRWLVCPECENLTLRFREGDTYLECTGEDCGVMLLGREYDARLANGAA